MEKELDQCLQNMNIEDKDDSPLVLSNEPIFSASVRNQRSILVNHYTKDTIKKIAGCVGRVIDFPFDEEEAQSNDYVRVRVLLDLSKGLRNSKDLELPNGLIVKIGVDYERLRKRCFQCQRLTHDKSKCPFIQPIAEDVSAHVSSQLSTVVDKGKSVDVSGLNTVAVNTVNHSFQNPLESETLMQTETSELCARNEDTYVSKVPVVLPQKLLADAIKANGAPSLVSASNLLSQSPIAGLSLFGPSPTFTSGSLEASSSSVFPKAKRSCKRPRSCLKNSKDRKGKSIKLLDAASRIAVSNEDSFLPQGKGQGMADGVPTDKVLEVPRGQFWFDKRWADDPSFWGVIQEAWNRDVEAGVNLFLVRAENCRNAIRLWKKKSWTNSEIKIKRLRKELAKQDESLTPCFQRISKIKRELAIAFREEEVYWRLRSREKWLLDGDQNTKYFQASVKAARLQNSLQFLVDASGADHFSDQEKGEVAVQARRPLGNHSLMNINLKVAELFDHRSGVWNESLLRNGIYSVKSGYDLMFKIVHKDRLREAEALPSRNLVFQACWNVNTVPKIQVFLWKVLKDALAVSDRLRSRGIRVFDGCILGFGNSIFQNLYYLFSLNLEGSSPVKSADTFAWILWHLWKNRNSFLFQSVHSPPDTVVQKAWDDAADWSVLHLKTLSGNVNASSQEAFWIPPLRHEVKCNIGFSWSKKFSLAGVSWVVRDSYGNVLLHSRRSYADVHSAFEAKIKSWEWALESMNSLHLENVIFGASTLEIINALHDPNHWPALVSHISPLLLFSADKANWFLSFEPIKSNFGATLIATSVTDDLRFNSYVASGSPSWLQGFFEREKHQIFVHYPSDIFPFPSS
ncbi:unnamed protein product [Arabidopsis halleri]